MTFSVIAVRSRHGRAARRGLVAALAAGLCAASAALAEPAAEETPVDKSDWESGWHVVRPGDTLQGLAERFLGSHELWRELHLLNPFVKDPDLLYPGQRLRIFLERPTAKLSAQILAVARDVRELPTPVPWRPASEGDVLLERDALRTAKAASARLRFDDGATVTLSEDSLVFIRRQTAASSPLPKKEIEIELGQIDVESAPPGALDVAEGTRKGPDAAGSRRGGDAIEIVVAGARSLATPEHGQPASTRSRRGSDQSAQFMVFAGKSTVSAAGASIEVPAGSGTSVAAKAKPGPVEALLPAPAEPRPAYGEELERGAPQFSWRPVPGADHYTVEVCRDPGCGALVARAPTFTAESLQLDIEGGLPAGELFWRVTAVAASGLDGFPTPSIRITAVDAVRPDAPVVSLKTPQGEAVAPGSCLATPPEPFVRAVDRHGAELQWSLLLDGRVIPLAEYRNLPLAGEHRLAARATDARGRSADSPALSFSVDAAAPWVDLLSVASGASPAVTTTVDDRGRRGARKRGQASGPVAACDSGLELLGGDGTAQPIPCATSAAPAPAIVAVGPDRPAATLRTTVSQVAIGDNVFAPGELLTLSTWDVGCGARQLAVRLVPSPFSPGRMLLEAEVTDGAGNRRLQGWHVARR